MHGEPSTPAKPEPAAGSLDKVARALVPWLVRRRWAVLAVALALTLAGLVGSTLLYADLRSGIEELLPDSALSVIAVRTVAPRMPSTTHLTLVLEGGTPDSLERFADALQRRLLALPKSLIEAIEFRTDERDRFVRQFGLLYLQPSELRSIRDRVSARLAWERARANPLVVSLGDEAETAPPVDFQDLLTKYDAALTGTADFRNGYYQSPNGNVLVMLIRPPDGSTGLLANQRVLAAVRQEIAALAPEQQEPPVRIGYSGEVTDFTEEQSALVADLALSTVVVIVFVLAALWLYYRRWKAIAVVFVPLTAACAVTFGIAYLMIGHLNTNTAFLGSIVIGNGINAGIIYVARYLEERRAQRGVDDSIRAAWAATLPATFVAAFGAGLAYLSLASTDFPGFSQFGAIGFVGMALCWLTAYLLLPPVLSVLEERWPIDPGPSALPGQGLGRLTGLVERYPLVFRGLSVALVLFSLAAIAHYRGEVIESNFINLRSKKSIESGSIYWSRKADRVFKAYLNPLILWGDTPAELNRAVDALNARRKLLGAADPFREIQSLSTAIPADQEVKVPVLQEIRDLLTDARVEKLEAGLRAQVERVRPPQAVRALQLSDLPESIRRALVEKDGRAGRIALAFPKKVGELDLHETNQVKALIRGAIRDSQGSVQALNPLLMISDISDAIWRDGPKATLIAFVLVCLLVIIVLRQVRASLQVIAALLLGLIGLVGAAAAAQVRVNFLNFVVLPITFGIGVDYAVNIIQRYRSEGVARLGEILHQTGGAVALCSATTIIGYGSLMIADNQALAGFGLLASVGEITCLSAALFLLPAWLFPRTRPPTP